MWTGGCGFELPMDRWLWWSLSCLFHGFVVVVVVVVVVAAAVGVGVAVVVAVFVLSSSHYRRSFWTGLE